MQTDGTSVLAEAEQALALPDIVSKVSYENAFPDTTVTYTVHPDRVKEDIILEKPGAATSYRTRIEAVGLTPTLLEDRSVQFTDTEGKEIFDIPAPFMYDNDKAYSEDIVVRLVNVDEDVFELIYIPNHQWLHDPGRVYPVTIDPTYSVSPALYGPSVTTDSYVNSNTPNSNYYNEQYMKVGGGCRSYLKFNSLPSISAQYLIYSANIVFLATGESRPDVELYRVTGSWSSTGITWNNQPGRESARLATASCDNRKYVAEVTDLVCGWYKGSYPNYGVMIKPTNPNADNYAAWELCSSDHSNSNMQPWIQVMYYPMTSAALSDGYYYIRSRYNGRYLDVTTGTAYNGSNVALANYTGGSDQKWYIRNLGDGTYTITSAIDTNYSMDFHGGLDQNESYLNLWSNPNNRFRIRYHSSSQGKYMVISPTYSNSRVLDVYLGSDGAHYGVKAQLYKFKMSSNQDWELYRAYSDKHASPNELGISAVVWRNNEYTSFPGVDPVSWWGYHYINKASVATWKKILLPAPGLSDALHSAVGAAGKENVLVAYGFTHREISDIGIDVLVSIISMYLEWAYNSAQYDSAVESMGSSSTSGLQTETFTVRMSEYSGGEIIQTYTTHTQYYSTGFSSGLVEGMHANGRFIEYK